MNREDILKREERDKVGDALNDWFRSQDIDPMQAAVICSETVGKIIAFAFDKKLNNLTLDKAIETHMGIVSITAYAYTDATAKMRNRDAQKPTGTA